MKRILLAIPLFLAFSWSAHAAAPACNNGGPRPQQSLDIASVTTGGTAVNALAAGNAICGGFIVTANAAGMCVNQKGTAVTSTTGDTTCVAQNVPFYLIPTSTAVSVNSSASSVALAGYGLK